MEFQQQIGELLTPAINMAHQLRDGGANIETITNVLTRAGFPEKVQITVRTLLGSELDRDYKPAVRYQQQSSYLSD